MANFFFAGGYYIDMDEYGQLRIAGPGNHLFCGFTLPQPFTISGVKQSKNDLKLTLNFTVNKFLLHSPVMGDIRSVRSVTEVIDQPRPRFSEMQHEYPGRFMPTETEIVSLKPFHAVFRRKFSKFTYGFNLKFPRQVEVHQEGDYVDVHSSRPIRMTIECFFDFPTKKIAIKQPMKAGLLKSYYDLLPHELKALVQRSEEEVEHLISYAKTSSYEYGTIFPRDWMESAELGIGDLSKTTVEEMYGRAMVNISSEGVGWHEDVIGELAERFRSQGLDLIDRRMVDIEPRYLLGLGKLSRGFLKKNDNLEKLRNVAMFVLKEARENDLITFKDPLVGNWRDSENAYLQAKGKKIAPFDVNAAFYPAALEKIYQYRALLKIHDTDLADLVERWKKVIDRYIFTDEKGERGYALCLYGNRFEQLRVHHTDEAYYLLYGQPTPSDCVSFSKRLLDPDYFYTKSGPMLVGANQGYKRSQYHGEVIWAKQSALVVAGLRRQLDRSYQEDWSFMARNMLKTALVETAKASLQAFVALDSVPELYYDHEGEAKRYDMQVIREGQVSYIQLWSAVGFRRILKDLIYVNLKYDQPLKFFN